MTRWTLKCLECDEEESFSDAKDITFAHWSILAWIIQTGEPVVVCKDCEYKKPKKKEK